MLVRNWLKSWRAELGDLVGHHGPAAVLGQIVVHRLGDRMTVGVVRRHERRLFVLAEGLEQDGADRIRRGLAVEALAERVARAVLAGGVVGAGDRHQIENLLALGELVERHRHRRRGRAGHGDDLVLVDEALLFLHRVVRLGAAIRDHQIDLLAEHALGDLGRDLLDQRMAGVDMLDGQLHALEFVFALHRIGAGARHGGADADRWAGRAGRPGAERRMFGHADRNRVMS